MSIIASVMIYSTIRKDLMPAPLYCPDCRIRIVDSVCLCNAITANAAARAALADRIHPSADIDLLLMSGRPASVAASALAERLNTRSDVDGGTAAYLDNLTTDWRDA